MWDYEIGAARPPQDAHYENEKVRVSGVKISRMALISRKLCRSAA
jgi:hypothetical protein